MHKRLAFLLLLAALLFAPTGPLVAQPAPYTINVVLSMTGSAASLGQAEAAALAAYEKLVNRQGGIHGTPVRFAVVDDQSNAAVAVQLATTILQGHPAVVMGSSLVGPTQAMEPRKSPMPSFRRCTMKRWSAPRAIVPRLISGGCTASRAGFLMSPGSLASR